jgi:uncharacterized protein (UPF0333 family)
MFYVKTKGQSTLEYVILLGFVVAALIAMGVYMKRGSEGQLRSAVDQVGEQYEARNTNADYTTTRHLLQSEVTTSGGVTTTTIAGPEDNITTKRGSETVNKW